MTAVDREQELERRENIVKFAQGYADLGWKVLPVLVTDTEKRPLVKAWPKAATSDANQIYQWWMLDFPQAGIGVYCKGSDILAIDIDNKGSKSGSDTWDQLVDSLGFDDIPCGPMQQTRSGGFHRLYQHPDFDVSGKVDGLGSGIDIRSENFIVVPPTEGYEWLEEHDYKSQLTILPKALLDMLPQPSRPMTEIVLDDVTTLLIQVEEDKKNGRVIPVEQSDEQIFKKHLDVGRHEHKRNDAFFYMMLEYRDNGRDREKAIEAAEKYVPLVNGEGYDHEYKLDDALATIAQVYSRPARPPAMRGIDLNTGVQNSYRFHRQHYHRLRHVHQLGWLVYNGQQWEPDVKYARYEMAKATVKNVYIEAEIASTDGSKGVADVLFRWAKDCSSMRRIDEMIELSKDLMSVRLEQFDADTMAINCRNGYLTFKDMTLWPHSSDVYTMKITNANYDPDAKCPVWMSFLNYVFDGNEEMIDYVQRALGYSLTGMTGDRNVFFLYGLEGRNGKSTLLEAILYILKDYGHKANHNIFDTGNRHLTELMSLYGKRMVAISELSKKQRFESVIFKELSGSDSITARKMHKDEVTFRPTHMFWMAGNHKPFADSDDNAFWDRLKVIEFLKRIPDDEVDPLLPDKLKEEADGIFFWVVQGLQKWMEDGILKAPVSVSVATSAYREELDVLGEFIADCLEEGVEYKLGLQDMIDMYQAWCRKMGHRPLSALRLKQSLMRKGFDHDRDKHSGFWKGVRLNPNSNIRITVIESSLR